MNQVIIYAIENEKNNSSLIGDIPACWVDTYNIFFINEAVTMHLQEFEANFLYTVEHNVTSAKKFFNKMCQRYNPSGYWLGMKVKRKAARLSFINNAMFIMKTDWKDTIFPCEIPDVSPLSDDDRSALNKELASKMDRMEFLQ